jgi:hypothetical protein
MKITALILGMWAFAAPAFAGQDQTPQTSRPTMADASPYVTQMNGGRSVDCTAPKVKIHFGSGRGEGYCQAVLADLVKAWETGRTQTPQEKIMSRAVAGVGLLRPLLKDPDSLQVVGVYLRDSKNQGGVVEVCYLFRAHNSFGGYSGELGEAILRNEGMEIVEDAGRPHGKVSNIIDPCRPNARTADITTSVLAALNRPATPVMQGTPAEQAKRAQQYADCLKLAVDNPSVVCSLQAPTTTASSQP